MNLLTRLFAGCVILFLAHAPLYSQETEETVSTEKKKHRFSFTAGAAAGNFAIDASQFNTVYSNRSISRIYFGGFGTNSFYFIAKYRQFKATGNSLTVNIDVPGKAEWDQKFYIGGLRLRDDEHPIYVEILYVMSKAKELITTGDPVVEKLTTSYETENRGIGFGVGLAMKIIGPIGIFAEAEYTVMVKKGRNPSGRVNPELGGFCASAGAFFAL